MQPRKEEARRTLKKLTLFMVGLLIAQAGLYAQGRGGGRGARSHRMPKQARRST